MSAEERAYAALDGWYAPLQPVADAIRAAEQDARREALEQAARAMCSECAVNEPVLFEGLYFHRRWGVCNAGGVRALIAQEAQK